MRNYKQSYSAYALIKEMQADLKSKKASKLDICLSMACGLVGGSFLALVYVYASGGSLLV